MKTILVIAELHDGAPRSATLAAIAMAKQFTEQHGGAFDIVALGEKAQSAAEALQGYGARDVMHAEIAGGYVCERYAPTIAQLARDKGHNLLVCTATPYGKDLLPRVAAKLEAGLAADIAKVELAGDQLRYTRAMYAGNAYGTVNINTAVHCVSVRQSDFQADLQPSSEKSPLSSLAPVDDPAAARVEYLGLETVQSGERPELTDAEVVVAGGRALKSADNFKSVLEPLVDQLKAAMGASRAACDAGYVPNELQIGQTGKVVAPKLYIAVGISGAIQHLAGMKSSKVIVAINTDKEAPIGQIADYFWVTDLFDAVPALTQALKAGN